MDGYDVIMGYVIMRYRQPCSLMTWGIEHDEMEGSPMQLDIDNHGTCQPRSNRPWFPQIVIASIDILLINVPPIKQPRQPRGLLMRGCHCLFYLPMSMADVISYDLPEGPHSFTPLKKVSMRTVGF